MSMKSASDLSSRSELDDNSPFGCKGGRNKLIQFIPRDLFFGAKVRDGWITVCQGAANDARTLDSTDQRLRPLGHIWKGARQAP